MKNKCYTLKDGKWVLTPFKDISPLYATITLYNDNCKDIKGIGFFETQLPKFQFESDLISIKKKCEYSKGFGEYLKQGGRDWD